MSLINRMLNKFAAWAVKRGEGVNPDPAAKAPAPLIWGYTITDYLDGGPYLTRILFPRILGYRPMLHKFHRPDGDRALHNHPWKRAFSLVLRGWYDEERRLDAEEINGTAAPRTRTRAVRWFNVLTDRDFHRVTELHGDEVWTLFVTGPRVQGWGFDEQGDGNVTDWREYINRKKAEHAARKLAEDDGPTSDEMLDAINRACGLELDTIGQTMLATKRHKTYKLVRQQSVIDTVETDEDYRERLQKTLAGE